MSITLKIRSKSKTSSFLSLLQELKLNKLPQPICSTTWRWIDSSRNVCLMRYYQFVTRWLTFRTSLLPMLSKDLTSLERVSMSQCVWSPLLLHLLLVALTKMLKSVKFNSRKTSHSWSILKEFTMILANGNRPQSTTLIDLILAVNGIRGLTVVPGIHLHFHLSLVVSEFVLVRPW